jgi:hypothetical protein
VAIAASGDSRTQTGAFLERRICYFSNAVVVVPGINAVAQSGDCGDMPGPKLDAERTGPAAERLSEFVANLLHAIEVFFGGKEQSAAHSYADQEAKSVCRSQGNGSAEGAPWHRNAARPQAGFGSGATESGNVESGSAESDPACGAPVCH